MAVSLRWGVLFLTDTLQVWDACVLLVLHGMAGRAVGAGRAADAARLRRRRRSCPARSGSTRPSAASASCSARWSARRCCSGSARPRGIFVNVAFYLPLTLFLFRDQVHRPHPRRRRRRGRGSACATRCGCSRDVGRTAPCVSMIVLGGLGSFFVGAVAAVRDADLRPRPRRGAARHRLRRAAVRQRRRRGDRRLLLEAHRPDQADRPRRPWSAPLVYGVDHAVLRGHRQLPARRWRCCSSAASPTWRRCRSAQTVVQLLAPPGERGRVIGLYGMSANGLRAGSGFTVGLLGAAIGLRPALAWSAARDVRLRAAAGQGCLAFIARRGSKAEASRAIA